MASDCKLCALLGATMTDISENKAHTDLHAHQLDMINSFDKTLTIQRGSTPKGRIIPKEKSKKAALFTVCRTLLTAHPKDSAISCSQCTRSMRSHGNTKAMADSLINHACIHLNKDLFACRQCHLKFLSRKGVQSHLHAIHSSSGNQTNYIDLTDEHQSEIMDMVEVCFSKAMQKRLKVAPLGKLKRNRPISKALFSKISFGIIAKHQRGDRIQCHLCPTSIPYNRSRSGDAAHLVDHARWHLDKPIITCRLCPYSASTKGTIKVHLNNIHSVARSEQNFKDGSSEYVEEISSILEDCFGDKKKERPIALTVSKVEKRIRQTRHRNRNRFGSTKSLLAARQLRSSELVQRFQRNGKLQCRICSIHLTVKRAAYVAVSMRHALAHFNKILFNCRRCSYTSKTKAAVGFHVRSKHCVPETNEFDDHTDDFHADFMEMLSKCFDWDLEPERSEDSISVTPKNNPCKVTHRTHGNGLNAARYIRASELIRNYGKDGKVICRICSYAAPIKKGGGSQRVFRHAMTHLDKSYWPYRCKLCSYVCVDRSRIRNEHLRKVHRDKDEKEFDDVTEKFHSEIMDILSKCFDWSVEDGEVS